MNYIKQILDIGDRFITNKGDKAKFQHEIQKFHAEYDAKLLAAQTSIIKTEAKGNWLQRSWRPIMMLVFLVLIVNQLLFVPYLLQLGLLHDYPELPEQVWTLITAGSGGYIVGRSYEKSKNHG